MGSVQTLSLIHIFDDVEHVVGVVVEEAEAVALAGVLVVGKHRIAQSTLSLIHISRRRSLSDPLIPIERLAASPARRSLRHAVY